MSIQKSPSFFFSVRFLVAIVAFLGYGVLQMQRNITSIAIVCMVNNTALKELSDLKRNLTAGTDSAYLNSTSSSSHHQCQPRQSGSKSSFVSSSLPTCLIQGTSCYGKLLLERRVRLEQGNSYVNLIVFLDSSLKSNTLSLLNDLEIEGNNGLKFGKMVWI